MRIFTEENAQDFMHDHADQTSLASFLLQNDPSMLVDNIQTNGIVITMGDQHLIATINQTELLFNPLSIIGDSSVRWFF